MCFFKSGEVKQQDKEKLMKSWNEWTQDLKEKGYIESGAAFGEGGKLITQKTVSDYRVKKDDLTGYLVLNVSNEQEAINLAKQSPDLPYGGSTVIRPCAEMREPVMKS
jgi:hypothetical protein